MNVTNLNSILNESKIKLKVIQNSQIVRKDPQTAIITMMNFNAFYFEGKYISNVESNFSSTTKNLHLPQGNPTIVLKLVRQILHAVHILLICPDYCRRTFKQCLRCSCNRCFQFFEKRCCY